MASGQQQAIFVPPNAGQVLNVLGQTITLKVTSDDSDSRYSIVEQVSPPQTGPPLHVHQAEDEVLYFLNGEWEVQYGDQKMVATVGTLAVIPRGIPHTFKNVGNTSSKVLVIIMPGGFEEFFVEVDQLGADGPPDIGKVQQIAGNYGVEFLSAPQRG